MTVKLYEKLTALDITCYIYIYLYIFIYIYHYDCALLTFYCPLVVLDLEFYKFYSTREIWPKNMCLGLHAKNN